MEGYQGIRAKLYDAREDALKTKKDDIEFYIQEVQNAGSPVLELGCGTGRVLIPIAESGLDVFGLEPSPEMLELAKENVSKLSNEVQERINLVAGDMRNFSLKNRFNTILIPYRAFQHILTPEDQRKSLLCINEHLLNNGLLIMHNGDPSLDELVSASGEGTGVKKLQELNHPETGNRVILWGSRKCDLETQISEWHHTYEEISKSGETISRIHNVDKTRHIYKNEMQYLLELCGYQIRALYGNFHRGPYLYGGEQIWLARKK